MAQIFVCKNCGITFRGKWGKKNLTCSLACRREAGIKARQRNCAQCGKDFLIDNVARDGQYCSRRCSSDSQLVRATYACETCGVLFESQPSEPRKYCSHKCFLDTLSGKPRPDMIGHTPWNKGLTTETSPMIAAVAEKFSAENHPNWKGGTFKYYGPNWAIQSRRTRRRDGYKCRHCGITQKKLGRRLDVHHIIPFRSFGYIRGENENHLQANHLDNLIALCPACHAQAEWGQIPIQPTLLSA